MKDKRFFDFNKEILYGELGAVAGAPVITAISALFSENGKTIAKFAVLGSLIGGSSLFLLKKAQNKKKRGELSTKSILKDLSYYTPAAIIIGIFVGYPLLYNLTKYFIKKGLNSFTSGAISEVTAFSVFLVIINFYRLFLVKKLKKDI